MELVYKVILIDDFITLHSEKSGLILENKESLITAYEQFRNSYEQFTKQPINLFPPYDYAKKYIAQLILELEGKYTYRPQEKKKEKRKIIVELEDKYKYQP